MRLRKWSNNGAAPNQILLRLGCQPDGPVYFRDHELELVSGETTQIAPSLESFIASLR